MNEFIYIIFNFDQVMRKTFWFTLMIFKHMVLVAYGIGAHKNGCKENVFIGHPNHVLKKH